MKEPIRDKRGPAYRPVNDLQPLPVRVRSTRQTGNQQNSSCSFWADEEETPKVKGRIVRGSDVWGGGGSAGELLSCVDVPEQLGRFPDPGSDAGLLRAAAGKIESCFDLQRLLNLTISSPRRERRSRWWHGLGHSGGGINARWGVKGQALIQAARKTWVHRCPTLGEMNDPDRPRVFDDQRTSEVASTRIRFQSDKL